MRFMPLIERTLPWVVFVLLGWWTYIFFVHVPYVGFEFNPSDDLVTVVYDTRPDVALQVGDRLLQVGSITWQAFERDLRQPLFKDVQAGQIVPLRIQRGEQELSIRWVYLGFTPAQFWDRVNSEWWLAYLFWLAGTVNLLFLRPKDERWWLLCLFNYLTALWLAGGGSVSSWHVGYGALKLRFFIWLSVPLYLHLHWVFPRPLWPIPPFFWRIAYLVAGTLAVAQLFQLLPPALFFVGFLLAVGGSMILLALHFLYQPDERRKIALLVIVATLALLPALAIGIGGALGVLPSNAAVGLLPLLALPLAYLYTAARHQLGHYELRVNRLIALYVFFSLLGTVALILVPLAHAMIEPERAVGLTLLTSFLTAIVTVFAFSPFERWFEHHLLGMPLQPAQLVETYASDITTTLDESSLVSLLENKILASLLVRQAVLLQFDAEGSCTVLGAMGVEQQQLPTDHDLPELLSKLGRNPIRDLLGCPWVRVLLPLQRDHKMLGLWLLGRRDPDDFYAQSEIATLQAIANQTSIALTNIMQAKRLRTLYQSSIERQENERIHLARNLHDVVLNQLAVLYGSLEGQQPTSFEQNYRLLVRQIRQLAKRWRSIMLPFGLRALLDDLIEDLIERADNQPLWQIDLSTEEYRYPPAVERHLFRIVEQACENALQHAEAKTIHISSRLTPTEVELTVKDDGVGFEIGSVPDLTYLLTHRHFGIVGMLERAEIIGAVLRIKSQPHCGTEVWVTWQAS